MPGPVFCVVDQNLRDLVGHHYEYDRACVEGARAHGLEPICLGHAEAIDVVAQSLPLRRAFSKGMWWLPEGERVAAVGDANRLFLKELDAALADIELGRDSVVFAHMIVLSQLAAWAEFVERRAGPDGPLIVLLLRYQPMFYQGAACEAAFRSLEASVDKGARVRLASDSARLSGQLERLTRLPVETFPIPHTDARTHAPRAPGKLRVISLGNARGEKGILELFDAARILNTRGDADDIELVLQVNDPNAEIAEAVESFTRTAPPNVSLIHSALSTEDYAALLASADIVATPYWRSIYEARTSGVFAEALAAGKPVVCTAETWMSDELARAGAGVLTRDRDASALACAIAEAAHRFPELSRKAQAERATWLAFHNPDRLVEVILKGAPPAERPRERRAAVLFPWGDNLPVPASGAANRVKLMLDLLATRFDKVRVLQDVDRAWMEIDGVSYETDTLLQRAETQPWFQRARDLCHRLGAKNGEEIYPLLHLAPGRDAAFRARVEEIVAWADVVLLEYPFWAPVVREACDRHGKRFVLTCHDVISDQVRSSTPLRVATRWLEKRATRLADRRIIVSQADAEALRRWGMPGDYAPTGLDLDTLRTPVPGDGRALLNALCGWPQEDRSPVFLFIGTRFRPNVLAAEAIARMAVQWANRHPGVPARFVIAGSCHEPVQSGALTALGFVEPLTAHLLRRCCIMALMPITLGTGVSVKTYEAFACGTSAMATRIGVRGIDGAEDGAVIEDDLEAWPDRLAELLQAPERIEALAEGARRLGDAMDYRRIYDVYLEEGGVAGDAPIRPLASEARRRDLLLDAAEAAGRLGLPQTARACIETVLAAAPGEPRASLLQARQLAASGDAHLPAALSALEAALRHGADPVATLRARADVLARLGRAQEGEAALDEAARLAVSGGFRSGGESRVREALWAAYHANDRDWALRLAHEVCTHWPRLTDGPADYDYVYASVLADRADGDPAVVEAHARRALEGGFDPFWCRHALAQALAARAAPADVCVENQRCMLEAAGDDPERRRIALDALIGLAWRRFEADDAAAATRLIDEVLVAAPQAASALYLAAELRMRAGASAEALDLYRRAEEGGFAPGWCRAHRADLLAGEGAVDEALEAAVGALEAGPGAHCEPAGRLAADLLWRHYNAGRRDLAGLARRMITAGLRDGPICYLLGEGLTHEAQFEAAVGAYHEALVGGFDPYWSLRRRAEAKLSLGWDDVADRLTAALKSSKLDDRRDVLAPLFDLTRSGMDDRLAARVIEAGLHEESLAAAARAAGFPAPDPFAVSAVGREIDAAWKAFERRDYEWAVRLARAAMAAPAAGRPRLAHGAYLIAECLQILGRDLHEAMGHYADALEYGFDPYWVRFNRAQLRMKLGDAERARLDLRAAIEATTDAERREAARRSLDLIAPESLAV